MLIILSAFIIINISLHPASSLNDTTGCSSNQTCGNVNVTYPFSLRSRPECPSFSHYFQLECNTSLNKLYLNIDNSTSNGEITNWLQVTEINPQSLIVDATSFNTSFVFNISTSSIESTNGSSIVLPSFPGPYVISNETRLVGFGCTIGIMYSSSAMYDDEYDVGGCYVSCPADNTNPECGNQTCCVSSLPTSGSYSRYVEYFALQSSYANATSCNSHCTSNYANLFHPDHADFNTSSYGLKLNWAIPSNHTTNTEIMKSPDYACSNNANLTIVDGVPGYRCYCSPGYNGDGYLNGSGCSDIDECEDSRLNKCIRESKCENSDGNYTCTCNSRFYVGDGRRDGSACTFSPILKIAFVITGVILGLALMIVGFVCLGMWWQQRTKKKYFMQNGGLQLQAYTKSLGRERIRLFKSEEMKAATKNYSDEMKLGMGGFGTVFKGILEDGTIVAIKKANRGRDEDNEQFLKEMDILTQINHRHIVKLLGYCLDTMVPLLVYEYVSNGNVAENLKLEGASVMGWEQRLKVARQTAEALAYLHAAASPQILHRDVKSTNVLLDENLDAKVADFGASRLLPNGVEHVSTAVQGTIGYLDPEYFQTLQLTDKSDVYSLGVMLVELITGLKPVDNNRREPRFTNLALLFIDHMQEEKGVELIDPRLNLLSTLPSDAMWHTRSSIMDVATLAKQCLALLGAQRPSMKHVANELGRITQSLKLSLRHGDDDDDESLPLLSSKKNNNNYEGGAVIVQNAQYYVQSSSDSMFIDNPLLNVPTNAR